MNKLRKYIGLFTILSLIISLIPYQIIKADTSTGILKQPVINYSDRNITFNSDSIIEFEDALKDSSGKLDETKLKENIIISTTPITSGAVNEGEYIYISDSISNYKIEISADQKNLVLTLKDNTKFSYFANYTISIKAGTIKNSGAQILNLTTDNIDILEGQYPVKDQANTETNPLISFKFKYAIDSTIDKTKITSLVTTAVPNESEILKANIDISSYLFISPDGKIMRIDLDRLILENKFPLISNATYQFKIGAGALTLRGYRDLQGNPYKYNKDIDISFTTGTDIKKWIYKIESTDGRNSFATTEFYNKEMNFNITGSNLKEAVNSNISKIVVENKNKPNLKIEIPATDITYKDNSKISFKIKADSNCILAKEENIDTYNVPTYYNVNIYYEDGTKAESKSDLGTIAINSKSKPLVSYTNPASYTNSDETSIDKITVAFQDIDGKTNLINDNTSSSRYTVLGDGSSENLVDTSKPIQYERKSSQFYMYIYLKKALSSGMTYNVMVPEGIVQNDVKDSKGNYLTNDKIEWKFYTTSYPIVTNVIEGSIPEDYEKGEKIVLEGDMFNSGVSAYFVDTKGDRKYADKVKVINSGKALEVYLPYGSDRLRTGMYTIVVKNDSNHTKEVPYGTFSIVRKGNNVPSDNVRIINDDKDNVVKETVSVSEDTVVISSSKSYLDLDLDKLMGENTLVRKIRYEGNKSNIASTINAKSKYGNVYVYGVTPISYSSKEDVTLNVGRIEPQVQQVVSQKLRIKNILSDFFQVRSENCKFSRVEINLPYRNSNGNSLKALRYDEGLRNWYEVPFIVDKVNKTVNITSNNSGIFVIVE